jgi:hypothetical protein
LEKNNFFVDVYVHLAVGGLIKKKSPCLGDSKHIFKLKIVQVFSKKNWLKKARDLLFYLHFVL